ncbi:hypothetical protein [Candidatus Laterigemmans baculatus]|uniref:hypothetical protein n=1 Tax=Candidatus Laterigemmans baculatus TaxID=2770505 RepID=UPI0013DAF55D|nr:hypothetical protein [Candidatus Laterigemmans baculatus]
MSLPQREHSLFNGKPQASVFQKAVACGLPLNNFSGVRLWGLFFTVDVSGLITGALEDWLGRVFWKPPVGLRESAEQESTSAAGDDFTPLAARFAKTQKHRRRRSAESGWGCGGRGLLASIVGSQRGGRRFSCFG